MKVCPGCGLSSPVVSLFSYYFISLLRYFTLHEAIITNCDMRCRVSYGSFNFTHQAATSTTTVSLRSRRCSCSQQKGYIRRIAKSTVRDVKVDNSRYRGDARKLRDLSRIDRKSIDSRSHGCRSLKPLATKTRHFALCAKLENVPLKIVISSGTDKP